MKAKCILPSSSLLFSPLYPSLPPLSSLHLSLALPCQVAARWIGQLRKRNEGVSKGGTAADREQRAPQKERKVKGIWLFRVIAPDYQ